MRGRPPHGKIIMAAPVGFEPTTLLLTAGCSTAELRSHVMFVPDLSRSSNVFRDITAARPHAHLLSIQMTRESSLSHSYFVMDQSTL